MNARLTPGRLSANKEIVAHSLSEARSFLDELKNGTKKYRTIASLSGQIAEAYRGRCVVELLQNAHDALADSPSGDPGLVTITLETEPEPVLLIANSGRAFEPKDFKGLCQLGQSPKDPNKSVGNKGLGFRSVLEVASSPEIWSTAAMEGGPAFVFRFDPGVCDRVAAALADLNANGVGARSPFDSLERLVDWTQDQFRRYRDRLAEEDLDGPGEARAFLSPYDIPLPIERRRGVVDELLSNGHATVVCLPLDGGGAGDVQDAVASVHAQLKSLLDFSTTLFLPQLRALVVDIDGEKTTVQRTVTAVDEFGEGGRGRCQEVVISRMGQAGQEDTVSRFQVWTRGLGGKDDPGVGRTHPGRRATPPEQMARGRLHRGRRSRAGRGRGDRRTVRDLPADPRWRLDRGPSSTRRFSVRWIVVGSYSTTSTTSYCSIACWIFPWTRSTIWRPANRTLSVGAR